MGRTGDLFAYMGYGVTPDIMTSAKALGNGFPIAAMLTTTEIANAFSVGSHGTTYGGNPLAAAVAYKALEIINKPEFLSRITEAGNKLKASLERVVADYPGVFAGVRGKGLMLGLVMSDKYHGKAAEITAAAHNRVCFYYWRVMTLSAMSLRWLSRMSISCRVKNCCVKRSIRG